MDTSLKESPAWRALQDHHDVLKNTSFSSILLTDQDRIETFKCHCEGVHLNYALNTVTQKTLDLLVRLANQQNVREACDRMFRGDKINLTENRPALHVALRQQNDSPIFVDGINILDQVRTTQKRLTETVEKIRSGQWRGRTGKPIHHIVNIGIGGSDLGPRFAVRALDTYVSALDLHFVANADAFDLLSVLKKCDPESTLFVVVSKTFTTQETLLNAYTARQWLIDQGGDKGLDRHFIAVSAQPEKVKQFGIPLDQTFPIWDWVGGRFSLWSAVGISLALAIGMTHFQQLLAGAAAMDHHLSHTPFEKNMPILLALLGIWQRNFYHTQAQAILSYSERLREFPRYLQQLEMESNGKTVTRDGNFTDYATAPILFGECGTVGQHSFHQLLHQGSDIVPVDFIGIAHDDLYHPHHHHVLLTNMVAQAGAFAFGQLHAATPHDIYVGGRPSNMIVLDRLDPYHFGILLALYEHKTFIQGVLWNINSFDQPGVELGKRMARDLQEKTTPQSETELFLAKFFNKNFPNINKP